MVETEFQNTYSSSAVDGKFILAAKAWAVDGHECLWEYEYALYNMNSERGGWKFTVPLPTDLSTGELDEIRASAGFHGISHHSGDGVGCSGCTCSGGSNNGNPCTDPAGCPDGVCSGGTVVNFDNTPWTATVTSGSITWATAAYSTSQNANALRWGTLYNFRFRAPRAPDDDYTVKIDLFKPCVGCPGGTPSFVDGTSIAPEPAASTRKACCYDGDQCMVTTECHCDDIGGTWTAWTSCESSGCAMSP